MLRPYHQSLLKIRQNYQKVFPEPGLQPLESTQTKDSSKLFKIKYSVNILPSFCSYITVNKKGEAKKHVNSEIDFMYLLGQSTEVEIFDLDLIKTLNDFKWKEHARMNFVFGSFVHFVYIGILIVYTNIIYINDSLRDPVTGQEGENRYYPIILLAG